MSDAEITLRYMTSGEKQGSSPKILLIATAAGGRSDPDAVEH
jgi:hypothetical protein